MGLRPTKERGVFYDDATGNYVRMTEAYYNSRYDTVVTASGAVTASTESEFFNSLTNKKKLDGNFPEAKRILNSGEEMDLDMIGVYIPSAIGNTIVPPRDVKKASENTYFEVRIDGDLIAEGAAVNFPPGYGLAGQTTENDAGVVAVGVPSTAAVRKLVEHQPLDDKSQVEAKLTWHDHVLDATNMPTLTGKVWHRLLLSGLIDKPATRKGKGGR